MKVTASVTKSSHQDRGPCYLQLPIFLLYIHSPHLLENKKVVVIADFLGKLDHYLIIYIIQDCSSVRIIFYMINKSHTLPIVYSMLVKIR